MLRAWLSRLTNNLLARTRTAKPARRTRPRARLGVERLEAREVPTTGTISDGTSFTEMARDLIGLNAAQGHGFTGKGYSVAVLDTGIHYQHPDLGGGWGNRVTDGQDFVGTSTQPDDPNGHGTHVAGIIGSSDATWRGIVPDVNLIDLHILNASGTGTTSQMDQALQWVINHQQQDNIIAVNMSIWDNHNYTSPSSEPASFQALDADFQSLKSKGVFIAVCAGNGFSGTAGLSAPGISPYVVSVGAVTDSPGALDQLASYSQRSSALGLLAPGDQVVSTWTDNGFQPLSGTSMATPMVAGAAAMIHQAFEAHGHHELTSEDAILSLLRATGQPVFDSATGLTFRRLALDRAMEVADATSFVSSSVDGSTYCLTQSGALWRCVTSTGAWSQLDSNVVSFTIASNGVLYELNGDGQLKRFVLTTGSWISNQDNNVVSFTIDSNGILYDLTSGGQLKQFTLSTGSCYLVDSQVRSFTLDGPGIVYELFASGELDRDTVGVSRYVVDYGVQSFAVAGPGMVYELFASGELDRDAVGVSRYVVDYGVQSFAVAGPGMVYELFANGELDRHTLGSFPSVVDHSVRSFAVAGPGIVYELFASGELDRFAIGVSRYTVDYGVQSFTMTGLGMVYELFTSGELDRDAVGLSRDVVDYGVRSFALTGPGIVYELFASGELDRDTVGVSRYVVDYGVQSFAVAGPGMVYELFTNGELDRSAVGVSRYPVDHGVRSFAVAGPGAIYELFTSGELDRYALGSRYVVDYGVQSFAVAWPGAIYELFASGELDLDEVGVSRSVLDYNVKSIALARDGTLYELTNSGALRYYTATGWILLDTSVVSIWLSADGLTLNARETSGTVRQFVI